MIKLDNKATLQTSIKWGAAYRDKERVADTEQKEEDQQQEKPEEEQVQQIQEGKFHSLHLTCSSIRHSLSEKMSGT